MKTIQRIIIGLGLTLVAVCFGALVLFNWSVTGWKALTVPTGSMRPGIPAGSLVLMKSVPNSTLKVGDVITYINPRNMKSTVTHRIIKTYKLENRIPAFITQGDANESADQPIVGGLVKGKIVWHAPYIGRALAWSRTWIGIAIILYLPALIVMIEELKRLSDYYKKYVPYKSTIILEREREKANGKPKFALATVPAILLLLGSVVFAYPVHALLKSNTVKLANNNLRTAPKPPPPACGTGTSISNTTTTTVVTTGGTGSSNVNTSSTTNQNAQTGNATNSGNTNGGSATSGNASNCSNTTTTIITH